MKISIFFGIVMVAMRTVSSNDSYDVTQDEWNLFKMTYNKSYSDEKEESFRKSVYLETKLKIEKHNKLYSNGKVSYRMGMNHFGDMTDNEFLETMTGSKLSLSDIGKKYTSVSFKNVSVPENINWVDEGYVTPVKYQGRCRSCWAFSATGVLEGQVFKKTGKLVSLSEQNLVDCSKKTNGCNGGWPNKALEYIRDNGGINTEESYPYKAKANNKCKYNKENVRAKVSSVKTVENGDENLMGALASVGPISVAIEVSENWKFYKDGVFIDWCSNKINHAVLAVGYGTTDYGENYWIVKNSWGKYWGDNGYILMSRDVKNICSITDYAVYAEVYKSTNEVISTTNTHAESFH